MGKLFDEDDVKNMLRELIRGIDAGYYGDDFNAEDIEFIIKEELEDLSPAQPNAPDANVGNLISRQANIDAVNCFIDRFEQILRNIRESKIDDSVCGLCEYDGAYVGQSGDWCNECPGFDKDDCFKLSDKTRKKWTEEIIKALPSVQPEERTKTHAETHACDLISRQAAIDGKISIQCANGVEIYSDEAAPVEYLKALQPAQPERRYTEEELKVFQHGISLSLLSKRSSQHWCYDEDTATEIEFLEQLHEKVSADMRGETE